MSAYLDVNRSILAYLKGFLSRNSITGFQVFDFDAHATHQELPASDLIGISQYSIENMKDLYMVTCMILVCTLSDDADLTRLHGPIDKLFGELVPGTSGTLLQVVDASGTKKGYMTVADDVMVMPVGETETRPIQAIAIKFAVGYLQLPA